MKKYQILTALTFFLISNFVFGQVINPPDNNLFDSRTVHRIDVTIPADTMAWLLEPQNLYKDEYKRANFTFTDDNSGAKTIINDVGFRLRGNTSRQADKKSFKTKNKTIPDPFVNKVRNACLRISGK